MGLDMNIFEETVCEMLLDYAHPYPLTPEQKQFAMEYILRRLNGNTEKEKNEAENEA